MDKWITRLFTEMQELIDAISVKFNWLNANKANIKLDNLPSDLTAPEKSTIRTKIGASASSDLENYIPITQKGTANGVATLDAVGKVPAAQLPSYVDDVIDLIDFVTTAPTTGMVAGQKRYLTGTKKIFTSTNATTGTSSDPESGKIYVRLAGLTSWRWSGSEMVQLDAGLALGETSSTAYRGDRGKIAYDHSQIQGNPHNTTVGDISGLQAGLDGKVNLKLDNVPSNLTVAEKNSFRAKVNAGTVNSVAITVPTGLAVSGGPIIDAGTFAVTFASGYSIPTITKQGQWDASYKHSQDMGDATVAIPDWSTQLQNQVNF